MMWRERWISNNTKEETERRYTKHEGMVEKEEQLKKRRRRNEERGVGVCVCMCATWC